MVALLLSTSQCVQNYYLDVYEPQKVPCQTTTPHVSKPIFIAGLHVVRAMLEPAMTYNLACNRCAPPALTLVLAFLKA